MGISIRRTSLALLGALVIVAAHAAPASAQDGPGFGVRGGWLFSHLDTGSVSSNTENKTGLVGGLWFGGNRNGLIGVMGEVLVGRQGSKATAGTAREVVHDVLKIPVLLRVNGGSNSRSGVGFYGVVGPEAEVALRSKVKIGNQDFDEDTESVNINLSFGGGIEVTRFIVDLRYTAGLRSVYAAESSTDDVKSRAVMLTVGFRFN